MARDLPPHSGIRAQGLGVASTVPALSTRPMLSAAVLSIPGFVFEHQRFRPTDLASGLLLDPVVLFSLQEGIAIAWNRGDSQEHAVTQIGALATFPSGTELNGSWHGELDALLLSFCPQECHWRSPGLRINEGLQLRAATNIQDEQLWHLALALKAEAEADCPVGRHFAEAVALAMFASLFSRYCDAAQVDPLVPENIETVLRYIRDNIHDDLRLDTLAAVAQMTPHTFRQLFRTSVGLPPHQFVVQERVHRARQLLSDRSLTIAQVAYAVGFSNQAHFDTVFRKFEKVTPTQYRERLVRPR